MRVLVCGSREYDYPVGVAVRIAELPEGTVVIHGAALGPDTIAGNFAKNTMLLDVEEYPADWETYGKRAGIIRNLAMLDTEPDLVIAFWDGKSKGTGHTIREAQKRGIPVEIL